MDTEEIIEVVEEVAEAKSFVVLGGVVGFSLGVAVGVLAGYKIANAKLQKKFDAQLDVEIAEAKALYSRLNKTGEMATPESAVQALRPELADAADALIRYQGNIPDQGQDPEPEPDVTITVETTNVFATKVTDTWDWDEEKASRTPDAPYIIHEDEYMEEGPHPQQTLTYYLGDKVLADERDQHIPNVDGTVGNENLLRFGHGTGDARTVFIRNEKLKLDFEVLLSDGTFAHEVLGLQHSDGYDRLDGRRQVRRMRGTDE